MGGDGRPTILFVGESVALAHVARPVVLARTLDADRYDLHVACDPRHEWVVGDEPIGKFHPLPSIPTDRFLARPPGASYDLDELRGYLDDELRLYAEIRPDLVVADFRYTASTSAAVAGVPSASLVNVHWSPHRKFDFPAQPPAAEGGEGADGAGAASVRSRLRSSVAGRVVRKARRTLLADRGRGDGSGGSGVADVDHVNTLRAGHGLPAVSGYLQLMVEADHVLYAEPPGLIESRILPPHHHFVGPVVWSPSIPLPDWWSDLPDDRPLVYVTMGSTGEADRLPELVRRLARLDVSVVVSTAGRAELAPVLANTAPNVFTAEVVPGAEVCARAAVVVGSGGSGTAYQALAAGTPVVGLWDNLDQYFTAMVVAGHGAGVALGPGATVDRIVGAVSDRLADPTATERAGALAARFAAHDPAKTFPALVDDLLGTE
jgi:UDP:flavonoid glycosyltransferase YjiC (YdhE family)